MAIIQTVTGVETPLVEDEGYIAAMVAKAEGTTTPEPLSPTDEAQDKLFAGKYKSVEELEKGYQELQKAFSGKKISPTNPETPATDTPTNELAIPEGNAEELLESRGLDFKTFDQEWQDSGQLSDESYDKLMKAGIPREMVDAYIEGQQVIIAQKATRVFDTAGGQEEYIKMVTWAKDNLSKPEIEAYNLALENSPDMETMLLTVRGLKSTYESNRGKTPNLIQGDTSASGLTRNDTFTSKSQLTAAMSDPRYQKDPAYRAEVADKLSRSNIF